MLKYSKLRVWIQTIQTKSEAHLWNWSRTLANWWQNRCRQVWRGHFGLLIYGIQFDSIFQSLTWIKIRLQPRYFIRIYHISILPHSGKFCLKYLQLSFQTEMPVEMIRESINFTTKHLSGLFHNFFSKVTLATKPSLNYLFLDSHYCMLAIVWL